jgi:hypothetical protein
MPMYRVPAPLDGARQYAGGGAGYGAPGYGDPGYGAPGYGAPGYGAGGAAMGVAAAEPDGCGALYIGTGHVMQTPLVSGDPQAGQKRATAMAAFLRIT